MQLKTIQDYANAGWRIRVSSHTFPEGRYTVSTPKPNNFLFDKEVLSLSNCPICSQINERHIGYGDENKGSEDIFCHECHTEELLELINQAEKLVELIKQAGGPQSNQVSLLVDR
jgi:hypothetical protein